MTQSESMTEQWKRFSAAADAGELRINPVAAAESVEACDRWLECLEELTSRVRAFGDVRGYGVLPSGVHVRDQFSARLIGDSGSLLSMLDSNIEIARHMRSVFVASVNTYADTDNVTRVSINAIGAPR